MKNRKRIIVAFLCVAMLVVGAGYAATADNMYIDGIARYKTPAEVSADVDAAIYFVEEYVGTEVRQYKTNVAAENFTDTDDDIIHFGIGYGDENDTVDFDVTINGLANVGYYYTSKVYQIKYDSSKIVGGPTVTLTPTSHIAADAAQGFTYSAKLYADAACTGEGANSLALDPGQEAYVKIVFTYDNANIGADTEVSAGHSLHITVTTDDN